MSTILQKQRMVRCCLLVFLTMFCLPALAQVQGYTIKDGRMFIALERKIRETALDSFIRQFDLADLGIRDFIRNNRPDSILKQGWKIMMQNETGIVISKPMESFDKLEVPLNKFLLTEKHEIAALFPAVSNNVVFGKNQFRNKAPFRQQDSVVTFFLRGFQDAGRVYLGGSFNQWDPQAQAMKKTDSGWIAYVKLGPGKYWYKFIVDEEWMADKDNQLRENDGMGNINSVFFKTNQVFTLDGFQDAKNVFLSGSFNNWKEKDLRMEKTETGWELPVYLAEGTHMYKFIVDRRWMEDPKNPNVVPDGAGGNNSVISLGKSHLFRLEGFGNAKRVMVAGSFNNWRDFELALNRTADGWEIPVALGPGNYEYKFIVDGKWIADPQNPMTPEKEGNSFLIVEPNYTFRLQGLKDARQVYVAGDFNGWNPQAYPMERTEDGWRFKLYISPGKVRYKYVVDGKWILDPGNKLWEQNEHGTGNSVIWIER